MQVYEQALAVMATFAVLGAALWLFRRAGRLSWPAPARTPGREMVMVERMQISPTHTLHLVEVRGRAILIAAHPGGASFQFLGETFGAALRESIGPAAGEAR